MPKTKQIQIEELSITPVDPDSPIPLYYQIEDHLRQLISSGQVVPGSLLPPELELCRAYGVGRHTIRMALSRLAADDLISRHAGRGTFIKPQARRMQFYLDRSFTQQMADMGHEAHSKLLEISTGHIDDTTPEVLHPHLGADCLRMVRLRFGDNEPIGLQYSTILTRLCPGLENYDFNQNSLYDVLARDYKLIITNIQHTVSAVAATAFQAELLQVTEGEPMLLVNTTTFLDNEQLIEFTTSYYRADKYEYSTTHTYSMVRS